MMAEQTIKHLQAIWRGPALRISVNKEKHLLGQGKPCAEVVVREPSVLRSLWRSPSLGFGEAYMDGLIEVRGSLMEMLKGFGLSWSARQAKDSSQAIAWLHGLFARISRKQAIRNAQHHYDISNDFYKLWLDPSMTYSCAYFLEETDDLATAQQQKVELICRKARLQSGQTLLDIGCGWGALLFHAAEHDDVHATGITASSEQAKHIEAEIDRRGLSQRVRVIQGDWRDLKGTFDRIVSVGMFEHVGYKQYRAFFRRWQQLLAKDGLSVLHTIGRMRRQRDDPWVQKYIFPGGYLPTLTQITTHAGAVGMCVADVENLRQHYAKTLDHWSSNFQRAREQVVAMYGERFARMWWLYLQGAASAFRWTDLQLWQVVLADNEEPAWPLNRELNLTASQVTADV